MKSLANIVFRCYTICNKFLERININMNRKDLIQKISAKTGLKKADAEAAVKVAIENIGDALKKGDKVQLFDFGTFGIKNRPAREGRNPRTGKTIKIAASKAVYFTPSTSLKTKVNKK